MREAQVRIAGKGDIDAIAGLAARIFKEARIETGEENTYFVAEEKRKLIGFIHLIWKGEKIVLQGIGVEPEFRGSGIGSKLLEAAISYCEKKSAVEVVLKVKALNPAARLYLKHGFFAKKTGDVYT